VHRTRGVHRREQSPGVLVLRQAHPVHRERCVSDAWDAVRQEAAKDATPEHPEPAAVAAQR
jgi:hypothetical protein